MTFQRIALACALSLAACANISCSSSNRTGGYYDDGYYDDPYYRGNRGGGGFSSSDVVSGQVPEGIDDDRYYDGYYDDGYYDDGCCRDGYYDDPYCSDRCYNDGYYDDDGRYRDDGYYYDDDPYYDDNSRYRDDGYYDDPYYDDNGRYYDDGYNRPYSDSSNTPRTPIIGIGTGSASAGPSNAGVYPQVQDNNVAADNPNAPNLGPAATNYQDPYGGSPQYSRSCLLSGYDDDYAAPGPYRVGSHTVLIAPYGVYTLFYPEPLDPGCTHPIVAWGNAPTAPGPEPYSLHNEHLASWGMVVAAAHNPHVATGEHHAAGIDYLLALNDDPRSPFFRRLSPHAGMSGHATGSQGANLGARHPYVDAVVNIQGVSDPPPNRVAFLCLTDAADTNAPACRYAVNNTSGPAMLANYSGQAATGYLDYPPEATQYMHLSTAWFRCFLANDYPACGLFRWGNDCPACRDPGFNEAYVRNF